MKYLKSYNERNSENNISFKDLLYGIQDKSIKPEELLKHIDFEYDKLIELDRLNLKIEIDVSEFEDLVNIDNGIFNSLQYFQSPNYDFYVDDDETNYLESRIDDNLHNKIINFAKYLNYDKLNKDNINKVGVIRSFFEDISLKEVLEEFKSSLSVANENSITDYIDKNISSKEPFTTSQISDNNIFNVNFYFNSVIEFIDNLEYNPEILTLKDFLNEVTQLVPYSDELEYTCYDAKYDKDIIDNFNFQLGLFWNDELNDVQDKFWINCIIHNRIDILKDNFDNIFWDFKYNYYQQRGKYLFEFAKENSKSFEWFISDDFIDRIEDSDMKTELKDLQIKYYAKQFGLY